MGSVLVGMLLASLMTRSARAEETTTLDVLSYNVWAVPYGISPDIEARLDEIANQIVRRRPDLVALQELWRIEDAAFMGRRLGAAGYHHHHFGPGAGGPNDEKGSGLFIASRLPIAEVSFEAFAAGRTPHIPWHVDWMAHKGVAMALVRTQLGPLVVANTHLQATYRTGNYDFVQLAQALSLSRRLRRFGDDAPLLLMGDLNATPKSLPLDVITSQLGLGPARSDYELDHILSRPGQHLGVDLEDAATILEEPLPYAGGEGPLSDHPCLVARYRIYPCDDCLPTRPAAAKLADEIAAQLESERQIIGRWSLGGKVLALAALMAAGLVYRHLGRRRRVSAFAGGMLLFVMAIYLAYVGFHFAPSRQAELDHAEKALVATPP